MCQKTYGMVLKKFELLEKIHTEFDLGSWEFSKNNVRISSVSAPHPPPPPPYLAGSQLRDHGTDVLR